MTDIQVVLVNDGSTDSSGELCRRYSSLDSRILYIEKPNGGLASARQAGLELATGRFIGFVDSDDWVDVKMFETMYSAAMKSGADIVLCDSIVQDNKKRSAPIKAGFYNADEIVSEIFPHTLASFDSNGRSMQIRWSNCVRIYSKALIDQHGISFDPRFRRCQDLPFTFECTIHAKGFYYLRNEYLYHNRPATDSLSRGYTQDMWELILPLLQYLDEIVSAFGPFDFSAQLRLRSLMFAANCIENEAKPGNTRRLSERLSTTKRVVSDPYVRRTLSKMDDISTSRLYRFYLFALRHQLAALAYSIAYFRLRNAGRHYNTHL